MQKMISCLFFVSLPWLVSAQENSFFKAEMIEDLTYFAENLLEIHPGLVTYTSPKALENRIDVLKTVLPAQATKRELFFLLAPIIDSIRCGHTNMRAFPAGFFRKHFGKWEGFFPLTLFELDRRILISGNFSGDTLNLRSGLEVLRINDRRVDSLVREISQINGGSDAYNVSGKRASALKFFAHTYHLLYGKQDSFKVELRDIPGDSIFSVVIKGLSKKAIKNNSKAKAGRIKKSVIQLNLPDSLKNTALLSVSSFSAFDPWGIIYGIKLKKTFKTLEAEGTENLIIDLRGNGGGAYINTKRLLRYSLNQPFRIIDEVSLNRNIFKSKARLNHKLYLLFKRKQKEKAKIRLTKAFQKRLKPKKRFNFKGNLIVLIDNGTYSAASIYAAIIKTHRRGQLIGMESGGAYFFSNAGLFKYLKLPHSRIVVRIPVIRDEYAVDKSLQSLHRGVIPDMKTENTIDAYFQNLDIPLSKALEIIN